MIVHLSRGRITAAWMVVVVVTMAASMLSGADATNGTWGLALLVGLAPAGIFLIAWNHPRPTAAELLYAVRQDDSR